MLVATVITTGLVGCTPGQKGIQEKTSETMASDATGSVPHDAITRLRYLISIMSQSRMHEEYGPVERLSIIEPYRFEVATAGCTITVNFPSKSYQMATYQDSSVCNKPQNDVTSFKNSLAKQKVFFEKVADFIANYRREQMSKAKLISPNDFLFLFTGEEPVEATQEATVEQSTVPPAETGTEPAQPPQDQIILSTASILVSAESITGEGASEAPATEAPVVETPPTEPVMPPQPEILTEVKVDLDDKTFSEEQKALSSLPTTIYEGELTSKVQIDPNTAVEEARRKAGAMAP